MEYDQRLMEHTEKIVADVLKYVLGSDEISVEDNVEFVIIDEAGLTVPNNITSVNDNSLDDIETHIAGCLNKIRDEYPIYPEFTNPYLYDDSWHYTAPQPVYSVHPNARTGMNVAHAPINNWFVDTENNTASTNAYCRGYQNDFQHLNSNNYCGSEDELPAAGKIFGQNDETPYIVDENADDSEEEEEEKEIHSSSSSCCSLEQENIAHSSQNAIEEIAECDKMNDSTPDTAAAHFQLSQTAMHQMHSTTTTTAFGVVHQQTSSTTTNFISNNLANALLTTPAAIYAQSLLAQQYLSAILKDPQQRANSANYTAATSLNATICERFACAQLLQQQILQHQHQQQQQQQAAIFTLVQQQKLALHNNALAAAASAAGATAAASNVRSSVCGKSLSLTSSTSKNKTEIVSLTQANECDLPSVSASNSLPRNQITKNKVTSKNVNRNVKPNLLITTGTGEERLGTVGTVKEALHK